LKLNFGGIQDSRSHFSIASVFGCYNGAMEKTSVREEILTVLAKGPKDQMELRNIVTHNQVYTLQGFYKAFKHLREEEVITVHKKSVSLSFFWIQEELDRISRIAAAYKAPAYQSYFGALKEGESISYRFKTLRELEAFWVHAVLITIDSSSGHAPIMSLTPHDWFQSIRPYNNVWWRRTTTGRPHWAVLSHATTEEMKETSYPDVKEFERIAGVNPLKQKESLYMNVVEDLIFEARFDERIVPMINSFLRDKEADPGTILDFIGTYKLNVERNSQKAALIEKRLSKYFPRIQNSTRSLKKT
jgi:hypothetical protein